MVTIHLKHKLSLNVRDTFEDVYLNMSNPDNCIRVKDENNLDIFISKSEIAYWK